jgi:hypothetical protein
VHLSFRNFDVLYQFWTIGGYQTREQLGYDAAVHVSAKLWNGGYGSSPSYYALNGCQDQKNWVTSSAAGLTFGHHVRFWQTSASTWPLAVGSGHHDEPCGITDDSSDQWIPTRDALGNYIASYRDVVTGAYGWSMNETQDRAPTTKNECGTYVPDDGWTVILNQVESKVWINN